MNQQGENEEKPPSAPEIPTVKSRPIPISEPSADEAMGETTFNEEETAVPFMKEAAVPPSASDDEKTNLTAGQLTTSISTRYFSREWWKNKYRNPWIFTPALILIVTAFIVTLTADYSASRRQFQTWGIISTDTPTPTPTATFSPTPTLTATVTPTVTPTPLPIAPADVNAGEILILIATYYVPKGVLDNEIHDEIRLGIRDSINDLGLSDIRVETVSDIIFGDVEDDSAFESARILGERYEATMVIWGTERRARVITNYLNLRQPYFPQTSLSLHETILSQATTQLLNPEPYARFVTSELPNRLTFLSLFAIGHSYFSQGRFDEAMDLIDHAIESAGTEEWIAGFDDAYIRRGWFHYRMMEYEAAIYAYTIAIRLNPEFSLAYYNRGIVRLCQHDFKGAIADFSQAIQLDPVDPVAANAYLNRGMAYYQIGDGDRAIIDINLGLALLEPKIIDAMASLLSFECPTCVADLSSNAFKLGDRYYHSGDYYGALMNYNVAIHINPKYSAAYLKRGNVYLKLGGFRAAINDFVRFMWASNLVLIILGFVLLFYVLNLIDNWFFMRNYLSSELDEE